jgi:hypothetical protein
MADWEEERKLTEQDLRARFEASVQLCVERKLRTKTHQFIPVGYFSAASAECAEAFIAGLFYCCITETQSVAEGLAKFLAEKNGIPLCDDHIPLVNKLQVAKILSPVAYAAFRTIRGGKKTEDRNDYHHLNPTVEQDHRVLEKRAEEGLAALYAIESEVFAVDFHNGALVLKNPQYWPPPDGSNTTLVWLK